MDILRSGRKGPKDFLGMSLEDHIHKLIGLVQLFLFAGTRNNDISRLKCKNCNFLTGTRGIAFSLSLARLLAHTDTRRAYNSRRVIVILDINIELTL